MVRLAPDKSKIIRTLRKRATRPHVPAQKASEPEPELSNYERLERRSRELEVEHAHGGHGTAQPPEAETPLLYSRPSAARGKVTDARELPDRSSRNRSTKR